jgi:hypothetical protein
MRRALAVAVAAGGLLVAADARAVDDAAIKQSIDRGVQYLRSAQGPGGVWPYQHIGATALAGLTLLECGVPAKDPAVQGAAKAVREASAANLTHTYSLSLAIVFLDRLGEPGDVPQIESLTVRLLAGQTATGGWSYDCPRLSDAEVKRLTTAASRQNELVGRRDLPKGPPKDAPRNKRTAKDLPPEIQAQLLQLARSGPAGAMGAEMSDNSNTQFATLALWVGRRHGLPVDGALARVDARFRGSQHPDGGWSYTGVGTGPALAGVGGSRATMTCAGLMALAVAAGSNGEVVKERGKEPRDLSKDPHLRAALAALDTVVGQPVGNRGGAAAVPRVAGKTYYFLWSLERGMVALNLDRLGKKDWYSWGAEILLANQMPNGSWQGEYGDSCADTCFALLFLRRSNLVRDLSSSLRDRFKNPGTKVLRAGGPAGVKPGAGGGLESPFTPDQKAPPAKTGSGAPAGRGTGVARPGGPERTDTPPAPARPATAVSSVAAHLGDDLVKASGARQTQLLENYRDGKGVQFTEALVSAIPRLSGESKRKAREALAERMTRMSDKTLGSYLQDEDPELRRAAALALAMKESKDRIPDLIRLLGDDEPLVERAAHAALKSLTGQDLGPAAGADRAERDKAVAAWKAWWDKQSRR